MEIFLDNCIKKTILKGMRNQNQTCISLVFYDLWSEVYGHECYELYNIIRHCDVVQQYKNLYRWMRKFNKTKEDLPKICNLTPAAHMAHNSIAICPTLRSVGIVRNGVIITVNHYTGKLVKTLFKNSNYYNLWVQ